MEQASDLPPPGKSENQTCTRAGVYLLVKLTSYPVALADLIRLSLANDPRCTGDGA